MTLPGTQYANGELFVRRQHWIEWDVLHHEYGHHVQALTNTGTDDLTGADFRACANYGPLYSSTVR